LPPVFSDSEAHKSLPSINLPQALLRQQLEHRLHLNTSGIQIWSCPDILTFKTNYSFSEAHMNRTIVSFLLAALLSAVCLAQSSAAVQAGGSASQNTSASADKSGAQANSSNSAEATSQASASGKHGNAQATSASRLQSGSTVQAELTRALDVRKNKPGDEVIAKTTQDVKSDGKVVLPKGSKIIGKVTQAQARAKGQDESQLGIAFDHAILKDGSQMPVSFAIQAVGNSESAASAAAADDSAMMAGNAGGMATGSGSAAGSRGGLVGGVGSTAGGVANTTGSAAGSTLHTGNVAGATTATNATGGLTSTTQGVVGMPGLTLSSVGSGTTTAGSVISSSSSNVRLDSGTRMLLRANGQ
jgi:hypothetical protein